MTDNCNHEHEMDGDTSDSDDDSVSLLCDRSACQSRGAAEDMEISDLDSQVGNKGQKKETWKEMNGLKPPESGISSRTRSAAGPSNSASQLAMPPASHSVVPETSASQSTIAVKIVQNVKIPRNLHKRNEKGETHLHKACQRRDLPRVRALIQAGISVNLADYAGWTALHEAAAVGDEAVVEELLKAGADVDVRSFNCVTPLHDAVSSGHYQVVKLLLQNGSNARDRSVSGLSALDMAKEENIKELLRASCVTQERPHEAHEQSRPAEWFLQLRSESRILSGDTSSEAQCHMQPSFQSSFTPSHNDTANVQSRESGVRDGAREPGDIQLRKKDTTADNAVKVALEDVRRKHTEISSWPLASLEDAGRYGAALTQTQSVLSEALTKQQLEKDRLAQKYQGAPNCLRKRLLRSQIVSLASRQRTLVGLLQKQMKLVEVYVTMKAKLSPRPPNHPRSTVAEGNAPQRCQEEDVRHRGAGSSLETPPTETSSLSLLRRITIIQLVEDEELVPNSILDYYWDKFLKKDCSESEDWGWD